MKFDNYEIVEHRFISDLNSDGYILKHKKTKAFVTLLLNDDENKVFYIGFRTPPTDSTGVAHILEHSVLCGSKKFPVKDPFIELAKGSLNTFLNAMTYPDKTVYPVASCNDQDFHNLVDVYLDAVLNPNIYSNEKIFRQEGWHYEMDDVDGELTYNGVVYNEMKGVYSSPDDVVEQEIMVSLYPDSTYGIESGGDPKDIPSLTYEEFLNFHSKYYHPSNSYIYLYGNMDAEEYLKFIDEEYLSKYDYLEVNSAVISQKPFDKIKYLTKEYSVLDEESSEGAYLTYNISVGNALDKKLYIALDILDYVLCSAPGALIKQALLDAGIGSDVYSSVEGGIYQPYFAITAKGTQEDKLDEFVRIIDEELAKAAKGLNKKSLKAALNYFEFKYREADYGSYPRGLMLGLQAFDSWLYDKMTPFMHIEADETYAFLKANIDAGYFEGLIKKYFIDNSHKTILKVLPKPNLTKIQDDELKEKLKKYRDSLTAEERQKIVDETKELKAYQSEPSNEEDLKKIPLLRHEDLKKEANKPINEIKEVNGTKFIYHDIFTSGIGYLSFMFNLKDIPARLFPYLGIYKCVIGVVDTLNYGYSDLFNEINIHTGGIRPGISTYSDYKNLDNMSTYFEMKAKYLFDKRPEAFDLLEEIIVKSKYDDTKRLYEILNEAKMRMQSSMVSAGHGTAAIRVLSYFSKSAAVSEIINGRPCYELLVDIVDNFDAKKDELVKALTDLSRCIFRKENLVVDFVGPKECYSKIEESVEAFKDRLFTDEYEKDPFKLELNVKNEAFKSAGQVQFVARAGNYLKSGLKYTGALRVLRTMMGYDYLWNNVRVLGGAYGCMSSFNKNGDCYFVSYRDPNLKETVDVYEKAADYIENMELDDRKVLQFVIGALSDIDTPMTPYTKGAYSLGAYLCNLSFEDFQRERDELLGADADVLHGLNRYIRSFMEDGYICVVGNAEKIEENKDMFMKIEQLI